MDYLNYGKQEPDERVFGKQKSSGLENEVVWTTFLYQYLPQIPSVSREPLGHFSIWFENGILKPTNQELNDSIKELNNYKDRLRAEIINISQKLRMSQVKIQESLEENTELFKKFVVKEYKLLETL